VKILLDLNVILDVVLDRAPFVTDALALCRECAEGRADGYVSAISIPTLFYVVRKAKGVDVAHESVRLCLDSFDISPVTREELVLARTFQGNDFEDNLQIACAVASGLEAIITRDLVDFGHSPIAVMTPREWLAKQAT
jgi:predicted nucleic acid-binding protein